MDKYVICIQMPDILGQIFEKIDNEEDKKDLQDLYDFLEEFENETEYADVYLNGELMVCFEAPSEESAKGLYKIVKKVLKKSAKKYGLGIELCSSEDGRLYSILYEE